MPITELITLQLVPPYTSRTAPAAFLQTLRLLAQRKAAFSAYPVLYFSDASSLSERASTIYALAGWHNFKSSAAWRGSAEHADLAERIAPFARTASTTYLTIDFDTIPKGPVVCLRREWRETLSGRESYQDKTGTVPSAFWDATVDELGPPGQENVMYIMEAYLENAWDALQWNTERLKLVDVVMRPLETSPRSEYC